MDEPIRRPAGPARPQMVVPEPSSADGRHRRCMATTGYASRTLDVWIAALAAIVAAFAFSELPAGSALRVLLVAPVLLWAPGYLLLEACLGRPPRPEARLRHVLVGFGVSPP